MQTGKFFLFGSRANGNAGPKSDWDVLFVPDKQIDVSSPQYKYWGQCSGAIWLAVGDVASLRRRAAELLGLKSPEEVDLFVTYNSGEAGIKIARLTWIEGHDVLGWIHLSPDEIGQLHPL